MSKDILRSDGIRELSLLKIFSLLFSTEKFFFSFFPFFFDFVFEAFGL